MVLDVPAKDFDDLERITSEDFDGLKRKIKQPHQRQFTRRQFIGIGGAIVAGGIAASLGLGFLINPDLFGPRYLTFKEFYELSQENSNNNSCYRIKGYAIGDTLYIKDKVFLVISDNNRVRIFCESYHEDSEQKYTNDLEFYNVIDNNPDDDNSKNYRTALNLKKGDRFIFATPVEDSNFLLNSANVGRHYEECKGIPTVDITDILGRNTLRKVT